MSCMAPSTCNNILSHVCEKPQASTTSFFILIWVDCISKVNLWRIWSWNEKCQHWLVGGGQSQQVTRSRLSWRFCCLLRFGSWSRNFILPWGDLGPSSKPSRQSTIKAARLAQQHHSGCWATNDATSCFRCETLEKNTTFTAVLRPLEPGASVFWWVVPLSV